MTPYKKGDTVLVRFPFSDLLRYKKGPALVLQDETVKTGLPQRLVAKITCNLNRTGKSRVLIEKASAEGKAMGLLHDSVVVVDHIATVEPREIDRKLGTCSDMEQVDQALSVVFGIDRPNDSIELES
jgi:mRNA interferase MazF